MLFLKVYTGMINTLKSFYLNISREDFSKSFLASIALLVAFLGALQDVIGSIQEWGFVVPSGILILILVLLPLDEREPKVVFLKKIKPWKSGLIAALFVMFLVTLFLNVWSSTTERGILSKYVPGVEEFQSRILKIERDLETVKDTTEDIKLKLELQNLSFSGKLINNAPKTRSEFLQNAYIFYQNSKFKEARVAIEKYATMGDIDKIDVAQLYYQILERQLDNPLKYLIDKYKLNNPAIVYSVFKNAPRNIRNAARLTELSKELDSLPLKYLLADYYWSLRDNLSIAMWLYNDIIWKDLKKSSPMELSRWIYGNGLNLEQVSEEKMLAFVQSMSPMSFKHYQPNKELFLTNYLGLLLNKDNKVCLYEKVNFQSFEKESYFKIFNESNQKYISVRSENEREANLNCSANLSKLIDNNRDKKTIKIKIKFIDVDNQEYGPWLFTFKNIDSWTKYDWSTIDFKVKKKYEGT